MSEEKDKQLGKVKKKRGRPFGSKDKKAKRKPVNYEVLSPENAPAKKAHRKDMLFLREIEAFGFKTGWTYLNFLQDLMVSLHKEKEKNNGVLPIEKQINERVWQVNDLLKTVMQYQFTRLKPLEVNPNTGDKVVLNFNLNQQGEQNQTQNQVQQQEDAGKKVEEILDLLQGPGGNFSLPIPEEKKE